MNETPTSRPSVHDHPHTDGGLALDLPSLLDASRSRAMPRRGALQLLGAGGLGLAIATRGRSAFAAVTTAIPEETAGPYPGDGSNGVNVLTSSGIVRSDIRSSFGSSTTTAPGVPCTVTLTIVDVDRGSAPVQGLAVYLWHANRDGKYSLYSAGITGENYLRGVQETDANGHVTFVTIYPGCYDGRWPHMHFEVYPSLSSASSASNKLATSQLALPADVSTLVYATSGYSASVTNFARITLATDNVFRDGATLETPSWSGSTSAGVALALEVGVHAQGNGTIVGDTVGDTSVTPTGSPATVGSASAYTPLASPRRLLDTRSDSQVGYSGSTPTAGSTVTLSVLGREGVPSSGVSAVVLNVTGTEATAAGFVTVWPDGERPTASSLNLERAGQTRANLVTVPVGADGSVRLFTQSGTHLVADVFGWYSPASSASAGRLRTTTPVRLLDTRSDSLVGSSGGKPSAGSTVTMAVLGRSGVPSSGVSAVVLNVTAAGATAAGYVTVWPDGTRPTTSNLNVSAANETIANQVVVPVGADGSVRLFTQSGTHLVVDLSGWYTDATASSGTSGLFVPVTPYRVLDTRSGGRPAAGSTTTLLVAAAGTAAAGRAGVVANVTATETAAAGFVTVWPEGTRPTASTLNATTGGQTIANHTVVAAGADGGVRLFTQSGTHLVVDVTGWFV